MVDGEEVIRMTREKTAVPRSFQPKARLQCEHEPLGDEHSDRDQKGGVGSVAQYHCSVGRSTVRFPSPDFELRFTFNTCMHGYSVLNTTPLYNLEY